MSKPKRPHIIDWSIDVMFGQTIIHGYGQDGQRITKALLWWSDGRFGTDSGVYAEGRKRERAGNADNR